MEKSGHRRFKEYLFVKMGAEECASKTTEDRSAPTETGLRKCFIQNTMLLVTLVGVLAGIAFGFGLRSYRFSADALMVISYPGEIFMRLLNLIILPLIIASLIASSASINTKMSGKIAGRTLLYFVLTSMFNAFFGIILAILIKPGQPKINNINGIVERKRDNNILDSLLDIGRNIFPDNIVQATFQQAHTAYVEPSNLFTRNALNNQSVPNLVRVISYRSGTNTLGLVFFCLLFGSILGTLGAKGQVVIDIFQAIFEVIMKMVKGIMWFSPIGISSLIAGKILGVDDIAQVMYQLVWFIVTVSIGIFFYQLVVMQLIHFLFLKKNPYKYYWGLVHAMLTAAAMSSTAAALPVTFRAIEGPLGIDPRITRFVLPIGCNINMSGTALFLAAASVFICQMNSINVELGQLTIIFLTSTACSLSTGSVPSASIVLLLMILAALDAPTQDVSLLLAVDWLVDRIRTTNNMLGDCYAAAVVEHLSKNELMACDAVSTEVTSELTSIEVDTEVKTSGNISVASNLNIGSANHYNTMK